MTDLTPGSPRQSRTAPCECGALEITVTAAPSHVHACKCTNCQRSSGSALSWSAWFAQDAVTIRGVFVTHFFSQPEGPARWQGSAPLAAGANSFGPVIISAIASAFRQAAPIQRFWPPKISIVGPIARNGWGHPWGHTCVRGKKTADCRAQQTRPRLGSPFRKAAS